MFSGCFLDLKVVNRSMRLSETLLEQSRVFTRSGEVLFSQFYFLLYLRLTEKHSEITYSLHILLCAHAQLCPTLCYPQPTRFLCPWNFPGKNTGVGCISYSRGSSCPRNQTRDSGSSCIGTWILYPWHHLKSPCTLRDIYKNSSCLGQDFQSQIFIWINMSK